MTKHQELTAYCLDHNVHLVAVSKTRSNNSILALYNDEQRIFGENKVDELVTKYKELPKDIKWHMIGHLQTNKVKSIIPFIDMIHGGDRVSVINKINSEAIKSEKVIDVLLQIKIAQEESKSGWIKEELFSFLDEVVSDNYQGINWRGVMGMATFTKDKSTITKEFKTLKQTFDNLKMNFFSNHNSFDTISMGMSGDYKIAIEQGATMIRVGSLLF